MRGHNLDRLQCSSMTSNEAKKAVGICGVERWCDWEQARRRAIFYDQLSVVVSLHPLRTLSILPHDLNCENVYFLLLSATASIQFYLRSRLLCNLAPHSSAGRIGNFLHSHEQKHSYLNGGPVSFPRAAMNAYSHSQVPCSINRWGDYCTSP